MGRMSHAHAALAQQGSADIHDAKKGRGSSRA